MLFGKLKKGGTVRVGVVTDEAGEEVLRLDAIADEVPVKPKKEEPEPAPARAKPAARKPAAKAKPKIEPKPKDGKGQPKRSSVPQLPRK